jgi:hypothetical protein
MSITNYTGTYQNYLGYLGAKKCCELRGLGPKGDQGATGPPGPIGIGEKGSDGATGATGPAGPAGSGGLYCCFGTYSNVSSTITATTPFSIPMAPSVLLKNQLYAVNISVYISGGALLSNPNITFNLYCTNSSTTYYPQIFSNTGTTPMYLTSTTLTGPTTYIYTGSINDYVSYTPPIDSSIPTLNVYISPTSGSVYTVKITATINPVSV